MLKINNLNVYYGGIHALKGISLKVPKGKVVTLIGANGAGKSTTLRTICRLVKSKNGEIIFNDENITKKATDEIVKMGIAMIPEGRKIFPNLTVQENLNIGAFIRGVGLRFISSIKGETLAKRGNLIGGRTADAGNCSGTYVSP